MTSSASATALRGLLPDLYFVNASTAQMEHHVSLLRRLPREKRIIEFLRPPGTFLTELSLCAYDDTRPGLLAKLCGTLAALDVTVQTASIFTLPADKSGRPIVIDTLQVSENYRGHVQKLEQPKEEEIRAELAKVLAGEVSVHSLLTQSQRRWRWPLRVRSIAIEPDTQTGHNVVSVHTSRHHLAVFRMAASIATLGFDTQYAQIHVSAKGTQGIFFVAGKITGKARLETNLRQTLQGNALPSFEG